MLRISEYPFTHLICNSAIHIEEIDLLRGLIDAERSKREKLEKSADLIDAVNSFLHWFDRFANVTLRSKSFPDSKISAVVFSRKPIRKRAIISYVKHNILVAQKYAVFLDDFIKKGRISHSSDLVYNFLFDIEELVFWVEYYILKTNNNLKQRTSVNRAMNSFEIISAAKKVFLLGARVDSQFGYLGDIRPVIVFQIRQAIELISKEIIGLSRVKDNLNNEVRIRPSFILDFVIEKTMSDMKMIEFPFDANILKHVYKWTHFYVHTSFVDRTYLIWYALEMIFQLVYMKNGFMPNSMLSIEDNVESLLEFMQIDKSQPWSITLKKGCVGKINNYPELKKDFEKYINDKLDSRLQPFTYSWYKNERDVRAYIKESTHIYK